MNRKMFLASAASALMPRPCDRLTYLTTGQADVVPTLTEAPAPEPGEVLGAFMSATACSTDRSNAHGIRGQTIPADSPKIIGHESCFEIVESRNPLVREGAFMVTLGDDWYGFAEREKFLPVLPFTDPDSIPLEFSPRATYFDPIPHVKAVCLFSEWFSGASLIEPVTHVMTSFLQSKELMFAHNVVVLGAGFCGQIACIVAKMFGATRVTVLDVNVERIDFAISHRFADEGFNPRDEAAIDALIGRTVGAYADVVFDALPGIGGEFPDTRSYGAQLLRPGGVWMMYSAAQNMTMPTITLQAKGIRVFGAPYDSRLISFSQRASLMGIVHTLIRSGKIPVELFIARWISLFDTRAVSQAVLDYGCGPEFKVEIRRERRAKIFPAFRAAASALLPGPRGRLVYLTTGQADVVPTLIEAPAPLEPGEVLGAFKSATVCATDKSNAHGILGHHPRVARHPAAPACERRMTNI